MPSPEEEEFDIYPEPEADDPFEEIKHHRGPFVGITFAGIKRRGEVTRDEFVWLFFQRTKDHAESEKYNRQHLQWELSDAGIKCPEIIGPLVKTNLMPTPPVKISEKTQALQKQLAKAEKKVSDLWKEALEAEAMMEQGKEVGTDYVEHMVWDLKEANSEVKRLLECIKRQKEEEERVKEPDAKVSIPSKTSMTTVPQITPKSVVPLPSVPSIMPTAVKIEEKNTGLKVWNGIKEACSSLWSKVKHLFGSKTAEMPTVRSETAVVQNQEVAREILKSSDIAPTSPVVNFAAGPVKRAKVVPDVSLTKTAERPSRPPGFNKSI